jgi:hypothetical protein
MPYSMPLWTIFTKWPAPFGAAVQVSMLGGAADLLPAQACAAPNFDSRSQRGEDGLTALHDRIVAADHQAIAAVRSPHSTAGAGVHIVDALRLQFCGTAYVVMVVRVASVDDHVVRLEKWNQAASASGPPRLREPSTR